MDRVNYDECGVGFVATLQGKPTNDILKMAIQSVINLTHRGAVSSDAKTGDGAGVLTEIPWEVLGLEKGSGVGMLFLSKQKPGREFVENILKKHGLKVIGWREVPTNPEALGEYAKQSQPGIWQILVDGSAAEHFERQLFLARKHMEKEAKLQDIDLYIPSFSSRTIVYKGLFSAPQLEHFYPDLRHPEYKTRFAVFHQRYSTNTSPAWNLAQPFRMSAHNGEINTISANTKWTHAREPDLASEVWGDNIALLKPVISSGMSDSAGLDNVLELLTMSGRDITHSIIMLIPEAWHNVSDFDPNLAGFYQFHAYLTEPWDGPAAVVFSDGHMVGASLDRNGLRPLRYTITRDGLIVAASETGVIAISPENVARHGRLGPGRTIAVDIEKGNFLSNDELKNNLAQRKPYGEWIKAHTIKIDNGEKITKCVILSPKGEESHRSIQKTTGDSSASPQNDSYLRRLQVTFGYTTEEISQVIKPMAKSAKEPVGSMGDDTPLSVLSDKNRLLFAYFKQLFAQVTNPPIDHIREHIVTSLNTVIGARTNILDENQNQAKVLLLLSPILTEQEFNAITRSAEPWLSAITLHALFPITAGAAGMKETLDKLVNDACLAVSSGKTIIVISDRGADEKHAPLPSLLCVSAVHHGLIKNGLRMQASIIVESGEPREVHHFACLIGYGASAVYPYLAYDTVLNDIEPEPKFNSNVIPECLNREPNLLSNYKSAVETGVLKIMSKMGISIVGSYRGAQLFEAIGLSSKFIDNYFPDTVSKVGGVEFETIAQETITRHSSAFRQAHDAGIKLEAGGYYRYRKDGEYHAFNPEMVRALHDAVNTGRRPLYDKYLSLVEKRPPTALRDLLDFKPGTKPIPVSQVEPAKTLFHRFTTGAMSYGALSIEAHETLAIAMNRIGGKSNSGEGGEDSRRYAVRSNGDWPNSAIKQVASGRFGVTPEYLMSARDIEIKIAQGSKPGEGGQLPGHKVSREIATTRHSVPGVSLISPPPHHDIYSIEDLAQLIYDLRQINPQAHIAVKLVAESGVGLIACGVAKAHADLIQISGHDGGTGASPLSSIKNAGSPWELGLSETHASLVRNGLRKMVTIRVDGGLKTGRDVVIAAMLGADEFGFGTASLVAEGCVMARQCHMNTCPVGVTSQDPKYRAKYIGTPEKVINFFTFIAEEIREILAKLGYRRLEEIIGRADLLKTITREGYPKTKQLVLSSIIDPLVELLNVQTQRHMVVAGFSLRRLKPATTNLSQSRNDSEANTSTLARPKPCELDERILTEGRAALEGKKSVTLYYTIKNSHRSVGARISGAIAKRYGDAGLPETVKLECVFTGTSGQSFGAFCLKGMRLILTGAANDYVGKGMAGGEIIIKPPGKAVYKSNINVIMGNTVLYGATGGSLFAAGQAGERFCVRNSGAVAVVEGAGDHACEYMTGGTVVILGPTGYNLGAGMTNGTVYVLDESGYLPVRYNPELVHIERIEVSDDIVILRSLVEKHSFLTGSAWAKEILDKWPVFLAKFWKVRPAEAPVKTEELLTAKE